MPNKDKGIQFAGFDDIEEEEEFVTPQTKENNQSQASNNYDPKPEPEPEPKPESPSNPSKGSSKNTVKPPINQIQIDADKNSSNFIKLFFGVIVFLIIVIAIQSDDKPLEQNTYNSNTNNTSKQISAMKETARTKEIKPAKGSNNILTLNEVYYCLAEEIRINEYERLKSNYDDSAMNGLYNYYVDDYNSRCSKFRYREGILAQAQNQVKLSREHIEYGAVYRLDNASTIFSKINANKAQTKVKAKPNKTVRNIQSLLKDLGFSPGPIDGFMGNKTRSSIIKYQKLIGVKSDGKATSKFLTNLILTHKKVSNDCSYYKVNKQNTNYKNCTQLFLKRKNHNDSKKGDTVYSNNVNSQPLKTPSSRSLKPILTEK